MFKGVVRGPPELCSFDRHVFVLLTCEKKNTTYTLYFKDGGNPNGFDDVCWNVGQNILGLNILAILTPGTKQPKKICHRGPNIHVISK